MREQQLYRNAGYKSFKEYCQNELSAWGGYRRINQLLAAKKVIDVADELGKHIKNERQSRPLLRLVKEPDKLKAAVALALQENPSPRESDFAAAANKVVPRLPRIKQSFQEPMVPQSARVTVSAQSHHRYGEEGTIEADAPNHWQQIVTFDDGEAVGVLAVSVESVSAALASTRASLPNPEGEKLLLNNTDLDAPSISFPTERIYPQEYPEAIAALKQQHQQELERLEQDLRIGLQKEARARAEEQVIEQMAFLQQLFQQQKQQNIQLQQRLDEMKGLRQLETENQQLKQRIQELEHAVEQRPQEKWSNILTLQATKAFNKQVKLALEKTIDLRSLALEPPKDNATECLRLMGMALGNLASAISNTQALQAAALILGTEATPQALAYRTEQLQLLPQALSDIKAVLAKPNCTWQDFWAVAQEYQVIEQDYRAELTPEETKLIAVLQKVSSQPETIGIGSIVAHADPYRTLYIERGEVVQDLGEEVVVAWDCWKERSKKTDRYSKDELRFWESKQTT
jgi:flagellar motor protein MotB